MFTLVIVGRPNVGKSTLFNRLAGKRMAIVDDTPGVTRDWRDTQTDFFGRIIRIIDTAGLEESFDESIQGRMRRQTDAALQEADAILFMIDGRAGLTPLDEHFANYLRRQKAPVILGINKCESDKAVTAGVAESYRLGLGEPVILSAEHGIGLDHLFDALQPHMPNEIEDDGDGEDGEVFTDEELDAIEGREDFEFTDKAPVEDKPVKLAIVGRPNVGKSTLLNALLGHERVMTGPEAGTTRDAIAAHWIYEGRHLRLVDTAGMRRKARISDRIEKMAVEDTLRAIRLAQVVVLVLDGNTTMDKQDLAIADHVLSEGRALIVAINKWDVVLDKKKSMQVIADRLMASLAQVPDVPVVTIAAATGKNLTNLMDTVLKTFTIWNARVPTARMNRWLGDMESQHPAPMQHGRPNRLKYITQIKTRPPTFALWMSRPGDLPDTYKRYLINGLRRDFDLPGVPVRLIVRASRNPYTD